MSVESLIEKVSSYDKSQYSNFLQKAAEFSQKAHKGQKRASGEEYFTHPLAVAHILADMKLDSLSVIVALLHDTVEDTCVTLDTISKEFPPEVADLVNGITKINFIEEKSDAVVQAENLRKLIIAISKDIRILLVKLADRLHNMRTLDHIKSEEKRKRIATETLEIFAPLAERIGLQNIKNELQDLAFKTLHPDIHTSICARIKLLKSGENHKLPKKIIDILRQLFKTHGIDARITSREKTPYSIWSKMKRKKINFEQLSDIMAFRIIVKDILDCYKVLGIIHNHYLTIPRSFKDYISTPKQNGYQSIHTLIMGPEQEKIEVQIRTEKIHKTAEWGVTAHWVYAQERESNDYYAKQVPNHNYYAWIKELLSILEQSSDPTELLNNAKLEVYHDQVFCFTPKGRVIALPAGATALDFAYAVHSDVGNACVGAKVNRKIAPLRTQLYNGDQVEIVTDSNHSPLPSWENFVITAKAKSSIKRAIRNKKRKEYVNLGRIIISHAFSQKQIHYSDNILAPAARFFHKANIEDLLQSIGEGNISSASIVKCILGTIKKTGRPEVDKILQKLEHTGIKILNAEQQQKSRRMPIKGIDENIPLQFASCCHPIPGDPIIGIHQPGKGVVIHISDCETLQNYSASSDKWVDLSWKKNNNLHIYSTSINVVMLNKPGSLATLAIEVAKHDANISNFRITSKAADFFEICVDLDVKGLTHLASIMAALHTKPCIHSVHRYAKQ